MLRPRGAAVAHAARPGCNRLHARGGPERRGVAR